jgi:hypothetical protein
MNDFERRRFERKQRQADRADRLAREASATYNRAREMASVIPFGQPILVGHHSEKRDRNYRNRIHNTFGKAFALSKAAEEAERRANTESTAISSDDPDAPDKLRERIADLEAEQALMLAVNKAHKAFVKAPEAPKTLALLAALPDASQVAVRTYVPAYSWEPHPVPPYRFSNASANLRRLKGRLAAMERNRATAAPSEERGAGWVVREDPEENRVLIEFEAIPDRDTRTALKRAGFKWSPTRKAWVRMLNNGARFAVAWLKQGGTLKESK